MKRTILITALLLTIILGANAQLKFGAKAGYKLNAATFDREMFEATNRSGFFVGPSMLLSVPHINVGLDVSLLYDQRQLTPEYGNEDNVTIRRHSFSLPVNVRFKLLNMGASNYVFAFVGPQVNFNINDEHIELTAYKDWTLRRSELSGNIGVGIILLDRLQVSVNFNTDLGMTGDQNVDDSLHEIFSKDVFSKSNTSWQASVALYF